ncbi:hypothetical protein [Roseomonas chloroacetimidivorans]|uniref:hypothetical protein n=1 Tax=Roseomonas chloroacetimidivorans TaxID=1766656 RepID=UPI003C72FE76
MSDFDWDAAPTSTVKEKATEEAADLNLIPSMNAWVAFAWDAKVERWRPTVVDVSQMDNRAFIAWKQGVDAAGGFTTPVCLDASDAHDQSRALFVAHSYSPGYVDIQAARQEFAKLAEADWARALAKRGASHGA